MIPLRKFISLLRLTLVRIWNQKWLALAKFLGLVIAIALVLAVPFYTDAVYYRILTEELSKVSEETLRSPFSFLFSALPLSNADYTWQTVKELEGFLGENGARKIGLPEKRFEYFYETDSFAIFPTDTTSYDDPSQRIDWMFFGTQSNLEAHIEIISGNFPAALENDPANAAPGMIEVLVSEAKATEFGLQAGETYTAYKQWITKDGKRPVQFDFRIAGVWKAANPADPYWFSDPTQFDNMLMLPEHSFSSGILPLIDDRVYYAIWYLDLDGAHIHAGEVDRLVTNIYRIQNEVERILPGASLFRAPVDAMQRYRGGVLRLTFSLYIVSVPVVGLLLAFLGLVVGQSVQNLQNEAAVLRSRGAAATQIIALVAVESLLLGVLAALFALPVGQGIAHLVSRARGFLDFSLQTDLHSTLNENILKVGLFALAGLILIQVVPVIGAARHTIISYKQERARMVKPPLWQRMWLDVLLLIPALYGAYLLTQQGSIASNGEATQYDPLQNPLLLMAPTLGIFAATLLLVRLLPILMSFFAWLLAKTKSVGLLIAVRHLARTPRFYTTPLILLIMTLSLSTYTATLAQTLDQALTHQEYYRNGADLFLVERGDNPQDSGMGYGRTPPIQDDKAKAGDETTYFFLPVREHLEIEGVQAATRVGRYSGSTNMSGGLMRGLFLGIDRVDFPAVAFWRWDFASQSLGALMNLLAVHENGVLVDHEYLQRNLLSVGDTINMSITVSRESRDVEMLIVGAVNYFPTWYPQGEDGSEESQQNGTGDYTPLFVGNLEYVFQQFEAVYPYDVWLAAAPGADYTQIVQEANRMGLNVVIWDAPAQKITATQALPERQGLFGLLSVGFLAAAFLTILGFLIYWVFSFRRRFVELGMLQAIGLSARQMTGFLTWELSFLTLFGGAFGTALGVGVSMFFIPYLQMRNGAGAVPPYLVEISWAPVMRIYILFALLLLAALLIVVILLRRMKIFQAIKLGETV